MRRIQNRYYPEDPLRIGEIVDECLVGLEDFGCFDLGDPDPRDVSNTVTERSGEHRKVMVREIALQVIEHISDPDERDEGVSNRLPDVGQAIPILLLPDKALIHEDLYLREHPGGGDLEGIPYLIP
ncbi:MAG: hypothetical protein BWY93_01751 [Euryarchaeota archaeon ADurb.BinA087]|nr:MAG: hypothetical protein BWY93_01751 [Euryarchaeota archaeon ADurb.BinA087]